MADLLTLVTAHGAAGVVPAVEAAEPSFIFGPGGWVALAMTLLIVIMLVKKVPAMIGGMLDGRIAQIRAQLAEATALRTEAEALRNEYQAKLAALGTETVALRERAEQEAALLLTKAEEDATALIARRQRMAEDRISAAERSAVAEVRETATRAAVAAAQSLIAEGHNAAADKPLIDRAIADIARI